MIGLKYKGEEIPVYEYQDALHLIMRLSDLYAGDITAVSRGGNGRNKTEIYNYPCSFDIETTTIKPGELDYIGGKEDPPIAFPYLFQICLYGSVIFCRHYWELKDVFEWISEYFRLGRNRRLIFFDHNLGYEYGFFRDIWDIESERSFALDERHPVTIYTKDGFIFRDSYKMTNMSLSTLTKDWSKKYFKEPEIMDYSVLRTPYSALDENTMLYSALDVLSLSDAILQYLEARGERIWTRCPTSTSFIRAALKKEIGVGVKNRSIEQHNYHKILQQQIISYEQYKMLKRLARGGNTHANRAITGKLLSDLLHFDYTSEYSAMMITKPEYPIGEWAEMDIGTDIKDVELFEEHGYCCMMDIAIVNARIKKNVPVPYIPISKMTIIEGSGMKISDNGRYLGGIDTMGLSIFGVEWPIIKAQYDYDAVIVLRGWMSRKGYLPDIIRRFILKYFAQKTMLRGIPEEAIEYQIAKGYVNGIFGMAFTDILQTQYEFEDNNIQLKDPEDPEERLEKYQKSISYFLPYAWGAMTACLGRVALQKLIDVAGYDFCYCDTDSLFAIKSDELLDKIRRLNEEIHEEGKACGLQTIYYDKKGRPSELGIIDREADCEYFKTFGAKKYITVEDGELTCTIAGVPKKAGGKIIGSPENFQLGLNFKGYETGKQCLWYNPAPGFKLHDEEGREIEIYSNVAMLPCDYLLSLGSDYMECLSVEGNFHWKFNEGDKNTINEEDYI